MNHPHDGSKKTMARLTHYTLSALVLTLALAGCGNKGPLYLPPAPVEQIVSETPTSTAASTNDDSDNTSSQEEAVMSEPEAPEPEAVEPISAPDSE